MTKIPLVIDYIFITPTIRVDRTTTVSGSRLSYLTQRPQYYPRVVLRCPPTCNNPVFSKSAKCLWILSAARPLDISDATRNN